MRTRTKKTYIDHNGKEQPFLKGEERAERNKELREVIVNNHSKAKMALFSMLDHARQAGDALLEVKRRFGHRLKWSRWRQRVD